MRRVLVIANPAAGLRAMRDGGSRAAHRFGEVDRTARLDLVRTEAPGHARHLAAAAAAEGFDLVLAVGGDGTAHEVANGLVGTRTALGVIPTGTMNLLARVLGIPVDPEAAAARLAVRSGIKEIRPGLAGDTSFLLMAGVGFDAWVLRDLLKRSRGKIRFRDYVRGVLSGLGRYPFPPLEVRIGERSYSGHSVVAGRAPLYGGFLRPTPRADLDRQRLDVCVVSGDAISLVGILAAMWSGAHLRRAGVESRLAEEVEVRGDGESIPVQLDGEPFGDLPLKLGISTASLRLAYGRTGR